eukprot:CAMPEP_0113468958 /NCGR_PEP_ID=MMETSP0014_2-20120614/15639_1 /TAXON_ID=2857 /ORGANISM="Nitzschia sp." /LENGTH=222 /DNA_ID=CAMNT_0000361395 /DNA_START=184 /DNA_END=852 /DNA_ORIENTATION=+ /assembly_acc=CAM_ASM_000159
MTSNSNSTNTKINTNRHGRQLVLSLFFAVIVLAVLVTNANAFSVVVNVNPLASSPSRSLKTVSTTSALHVSTDPSPAAAAAADASAASVKEEDDDIPIDYESPEDAIINIKPKAMSRLRELREKEQQGKEEEVRLVLRMGVRNGGCSGLSYVMDFSSEDSITDDDQVDEYPAERLKCVVDAKSMLYLYGLELDYSDELIGGGFKFFNPNAEESCGCGSSFGV